MRFYHKTMEKKCSAWVLCPSKRFPGQYYYFNTQTGEKAWSRTVPAGQTRDGKPKEKPHPTTATMFTNSFFNVANERRKRRSNTNIKELIQAMKKAKISSTPSCTSEQDNPEWNSDEVDYGVRKCDDDTASLMTQNPVNMLRLGNENVKVCINFLRNLSMSEYDDTWYLVPDVEVLLDNFNFLKKFIAGDQTCSVMTPGAVLAKLQFLRDNCRVEDRRATVAGQVIQWLTENFVCQSNMLDCSLDDNTIHKKIVEYCKEVNIFHVVIITKSKNLYDQAKRNDIHVYYLNALKIINQTENLFLLDPNNTDTFKWPTTNSANNVFNRKQNAYKNLEIRVNRNGEQSFISHTFDGREISNVFESQTNKNKSLENDVRISDRNDSTLNTSEGFFVEEKIREFSTQHAHLQANVIERIDECTCSFLQIMEHCLHNVFQRIPSTQFDPPCWLQQGLQLLKELYYQNKKLCASVEHLILMCGFRFNHGTMRPIIKADNFIKILGAGILVIEQLEKILKIPELSDSKEMMSDLTASIQTAEEFPKVFSISSECRRILGDEPFRMEGVKSTENGSCSRFVSGVERTPQHENKSNAVIQQNNEEMQITDNAVNCMTVSSEKQSDKSSSSVILQTIYNGGPVFQKLKNTVDMIRHALTRMKLFIELRMEELKKGAIPERRKECLREKSMRLLDYAAGMVKILKIIQKRENPNDPSFGKKFAVRNPAYTECIEHCLEQVENMHRSFIYLLEALK